MTSVVQIYLNSETATKNLSGTKNSDLLFLFNSPIVPPLNHNMTLRIVNLYVPVSFYLVNESNNTLTLNGVDYTLTEGNYTASSLATLVQDTVAVDDPSFTVSFNSDTNKYTFSSGLGEFTIGGTILYVLGFSDTATSTSQALTSTQPVDLTGDNVIFLNVKNLNTFNLSSSSGGRTSIVGSVLVTVPCGSVLYWENPSSSTYTIEEDSISFIHLQLLGENGVSLLDLNNFNWSVTLEVGFVPKVVQPSVPSSFRDVYVNYLKSLE